MKNSNRSLAKGLVASLASLLLAAECNEASLVISGPLPDTVSVDVASSLTRTFTVRNAGGVAAKLGQVSSAGLGLEPPYSLAGGTCVTNATLAAGGTCSLEIRVSPMQVGILSDSIELRYTWDGNGSAGRVALQAVSTESRAPIADGPWTEVWEEWSTPVGVPSTDGYTIVNSSSHDVTLGDIGSAGLGLAAPFSWVSGTCVSGQVLPAQGGMCWIDVEFAPARVGSFSEVVELEYTWPASPEPVMTARFSITAASTPPLAISGAAYFDLTPIGGEAIETYTVTNTGGAEATLGNVTSAALGLAAPFSLASGTCATGTRLAALTGSCSLQMRFSPVAAATTLDVLELRYAYPGNADLTATQAIGASAAAATATDCFISGCASGHVCWEITSNPSHSGTCVEVPPPPPNCMAPCLWEARKNCLPIMRDCRYTTAERAATKSDPLSGWAIDYMDGAGPLSNRKWRKDASVCFSEWVGRIDSTTGSYSYTNGTQPIGVAVGNADSAPVYCGPYASVTDVPAGEKAYAQGHSLACEDWKRTYLDLTECHTTSTEGACSSP
ncbi:MAG TPA: choice-of-anchor D domain-containing protein [Polyangiaceae bacterium]|nr:choice-of-anchor D domain-containing protein [Polyangiaceae bacterium]